MKLHYDPDTDSLYIDLNARPGADAQEITDGLVIDFDAEGQPVGIDIQHASQPQPVDAGDARFADGRRQAGMRVLG